MPKRITASDAKNGFGGLLEDVTALGRVDVVRHGRLVAVVLSPSTFQALESRRGDTPVRATARHADARMIPAALARSARMKREPGGFDDEWG